MLPTSHTTSLQKGVGWEVGQTDRDTRAESDGSRKTKTGNGPKKRVSRFCINNRISRCQEYCLVSSKPVN